MKTGIDNKWDERFSDMADLVATWSKDPDSKVGAVIVSPSKRQFSMGYNGFISGADDCYSMETWQKLEQTVHAELNALLNVRGSVEAWTLYSTKFPCIECAKALIQAGVGRVVSPWPEGGDSKWAESQRSAHCMMVDAGLTVVGYEEDGIPF